MKYILSILIVLFCFCNTTQSKTACLNLGLTLGYQLGDNGGIVYGFELGITNDYVIKLLDKDKFTLKNNMYGVTAKVDYCRNVIKAHIGAEFYTSTFGLSLGPTIINKDSKTSNGFSLCVFGFADYYGLSEYYDELIIGVFPYYEYTHFYDNEKYSISQIGVMQKLPLQLEFNNILNRAH